LKLSVNCANIKEVNSFVFREFIKYIETTDGNQSGKPGGWEWSAILQQDRYCVNSETSGVKAQPLVNNWEGEVLYGSSQDTGRL